MGYACLTIAPCSCCSCRVPLAAGEESHLHVPRGGPAGEWHAMQCFDRVLMGSVDSAVLCERCPVNPPTSGGIVRGSDVCGVSGRYGNGSNNGG